MCHLKELLGPDDNQVSTKALVTYKDLASKSHMPERTLDFKIKHLRSKQVRKFKIKLMDSSIDNLV
jgi:hypothetical protein